MPKFSVATLDETAPDFEFPRVCPQCRSDFRETSSLKVYVWALVQVEAEIGSDGQVNEHDTDEAGDLGPRDSLFCAACDFRLSPDPMPPAGSGKRRK